MKTNGLKRKVRRKVKERKMMRKIMRIAGGGGGGESYNFQITLQMPPIFILFSHQMACPAKVMERAWSPGTRVEFVARFLTEQVSLAVLLSKHSC